MSQSDDIRVDRVPRRLLETAWPHAVGLLRKGAEVSDLTTTEIAIRLKDRTAELWFVTDAQQKALMAVFCTERVEHEDGTEFIGVFALGGEGMTRWAKPVREALSAYAAREGLASFRFYGRKPWGRVSPECRIIGRHDDRTYIFEGDAL